MISSLQAVEPPCLLELSSALNPSLKYDQAVSAVKEGVSKTFYRVHEKVKSRAMTQAQWVAFFGAMQNARDCLIAKTALQGGKRINEVLSLTTEQIDWDRNEITFVQSKTKGMHKETVITYPKHFMEALKAYIGDRQGLVFMTRTGKTVLLRQVANSFEKAGIKANIPFKGGLKPNGTRTYAKEIYPLHVVSIAWKGDFNKRHKVSSDFEAYRGLWPAEAVKSRDGMTGSLS